MKLKEAALWLIMQAPEKFSSFHDRNKKIIEKLANFQLGHILYAHGQNWIPLTNKIILLKSDNCITAIFYFYFFKFSQKNERQRH